MGYLNWKLRVGTRPCSVFIDEQENEFVASFNFDRDLINLIKSTFEAKWDAANKEWRFKNNDRNKFQLRNLNPDCDSPYKRFEGLDQLPLPITHRPLRPEQLRDLAIVLHTGTLELAWEMGLGKTLVAIELTERIKGKVLYVGVRSALAAARLEYKYWKAAVWPTFVTWSGLRRVVAEWDGPAPDVLILDEYSKAKNPASERSRAAQYIADSMRKEGKGYILGMTGTPSPKDPSDWWSQTEILCPGFLREGSVKELKKRLALIKYEENLQGGSYPKLVTWFDNPEKCKICGKFKHSPAHLIPGIDFHRYQPSKDEIQLLHNRLKGLVSVRLKKDYLDLPEKIYREAVCTPTPEIVRMAKLDLNHNKLRQLSDGFQYIEVERGTKTCTVCLGTSECLQPEVSDNPFVEEAKLVMGKCLNCNNGQEPIRVRESVRIDCPKDQALVDLLEENEDIGRIVIFAGFTESVDRCVGIAVKQGWYVVRVDGRGWVGFKPDGTTERLSDDQYLELFQQKVLDRTYPNMAYVGEAGSGGMGVTLTQASMVVFFSNSDNGEGRMQAEDRIHRPGMDYNRGAVITDIIHLPTDRIIRDRLKQKKRLQDITMGEFEEILNER